MAKRRERVAPPAAPGGWDFRYATSDAAKGWLQISAVVPGNARAAWESITLDPRSRGKRQHPLKDALARRVVNGTEMEQWQYEVTAGGRIWYCIDDLNRTVWMTAAHSGHPRATE